MASALDTLFTLQKIDQQLLEKKRVVATFEERLAGRRREMARCKARLDELVAERKRRVTERALAERKLADAQDLLKERRQRATRVRTEKELRANESELAAMREEISDQEEQLLVAMEAVEELERQIAEVQREHDELAEADHREIEAESARIEGLKDELVNEQRGREEIANGLESSLRRRYERVLERRHGLALVAVEGNTCGGCHMSVPPQTVNEILRTGAIHVCPSCQRILYAEPAS